MAKTNTPAPQTADEAAKQVHALAVAGIPLVAETNEEASARMLRERAQKILDRAIVLSGVAPNEFAALSVEEKEAFVAAAEASLKTEPENQQPKLSARPAEGLMRVAKDGIVMDVHNTALQDHLNLGWKLVA